ncbi:ABC transporter permease subunit [Allonocardiopsis opalescens]|uniref:Binding-protein-dependent transport system inner membrane component n=1 Tax=Allonocardiopsis opalescens TaxID=1144618 RepID=A0A2T0PTV7_9ACTN|nr:ABC transporter permease subunit [Allonocardiopsis opalescens]PRX92331.1 binding-protein-dependent transport system inner membrane component [Allonocardiopsis opalescens]
MATDHRSDAGPAVDTPSAAGTGGPAAPDAGTAQAGASGRLGPPRWLAYLFLLPALLLLGALVIYPILYSVWRSLFDRTGDVFVGVDNYADALADPDAVARLGGDLGVPALVPLIAVAIGLLWPTLSGRMGWGEWSLGAGLAALAAAIVAVLIAAPGALAPLRVSALWAVAVPTAVVALALLRPALERRVGWIAWAVAVVATPVAGLLLYTLFSSDQSVLVALRNNAVWVVVAPTVVTALGLVFAVLTERIAWRTAFKLIVFMPMAISFLASGVIFRLVYEQDPQRGIANAVITTIADAFGESSQYPEARPRPDGGLAEAPGGGFEAQAPAQVGGDPVLLPLVGLPPDQLPGDAAPAVAAQSAPGELTGTVWLDFTPGGGGTEGAVDGGEPGLPGMAVQAVRDGEVAATTEAAPDGTFAFADLPEGDYTVRLAPQNFTAAFGGVTWLGPGLVTPAIIAAYVWVWAGFAMVLISAGLAAIPREAQEAARVDGATEWQVFRRVTIPLLSPVLLVVFVTLVIYVLKVFDLVFIIAPGSVQQDANVLALEMWRVSFGGGNDQGMGSTLAIFLLLLVLPAMIFNIRRFRQEQQ